MLLSLIPPRLFWKSSLLPAAVDRAGDVEVGAGGHRGEAVGAHHGALVRHAPRQVADRRFDRVHALPEGVLDGLVVDAEHQRVVVPVPVDEGQREPEVVAGARGEAVAEGVDRGVGRQDARRVGPGGVGEQPIVAAPGVRSGVGEHPHLHLVELLARSRHERVLDGQLVLELPEVFVGDPRGQALARGSRRVVVVPLDGAVEGDPVVDLQVEVDGAGLLARLQHRRDAPVPRPVRPREVALEVLGAHQGAALQVRRGLAHAALGVPVDPRVVDADGSEPRLDHLDPHAPVEQRLLRELDRHGREAPLFVGGLQRVPGRLDVAHVAPGPQVRLHDPLHLARRDQGGADHLVGLDLELGTLAHAAGQAEALVDHDLRDRHVLGAELLDLVELAGALEAPGAVRSRGIGCEGEEQARRREARRARAGGGHPRAR